MKTLIKAVDTAIKADINSSIKHFTLLKGNVVAYFDGKLTEEDVKAIIELYSKGFEDTKISTYTMYKALYNNILLLNKVWYLEILGDKDILSLNRDELKKVILANKALLKHKKAFYLKKIKELTKGLKFEAAAKALETAIFLDKNDKGMIKEMIIDYLSFLENRVEIPKNKEVSTTENKVVPKVETPKNEDKVSTTETPKKVLLERITLLSDKECIKVLEFISHL